MTAEEEAEWDQGVVETWLRVRANCMPEVNALIDAGWKWELPEIVNQKEGEPITRSTEPWQWYWRSPPKRAKSKGRKYWSTTQAFNALNRMKKNEPTP